MIEMCLFICQVQTALGRETVRRGWNMALKKWIFYILSILPKLYLAQKPGHHNRKERSTFLKRKGFQFTKTSFIMGLRNSWNRKVLNGYARKRNAGKSFFTHWFHFGCHPFLNHINLLRAQARRPLPQYSGCTSPAGMAAVQIASTSRQIPHLTGEQMSLGEAQRLEKGQGSMLLLVTIIIVIINLSLLILLLFY